MSGKFTKEQSANYLACLMDSVVAYTGVDGLSYPVVTPSKRGNTKVFSITLSGQTKWWELDMFNGVHCSHVRTFLSTKIIQDFKYDVSFPDEYTVKIG